MNLTYYLQSELEKINSKVKLLDKFHDINVNTENYAISQNGQRFISVNKLENSNYLLQIEEIEFIVGTYQTQNLNEISEIVDFWLTKNESISLIKDKIIIDPFYNDLMNLSEEQIVIKRWKNLSNQIKNKNIDFDFDLFKEMQKHFYTLYPFFSLDYLWFSNIIGMKNVNFETPFISTFNNIFEIRNEIGDKNSIFSSSVSKEIVQKTNDLLNYKNEIAKNPVK